MLILMKVAGMIPMSTYLMNMIRKTQQSTKITWIMLGRWVVLRPIFAYPITINTLSMIVKLIVTGLLRHKYKSSIIINTITYLIFMNKFMNTTRRNI